MLDIQKKFTQSFFVLLSLPATAMGFALCIQISALSWILSTQYKLDIHEVGIVWAAGPLAGIVGQVLIGIISDKVWFWGGRRRPFILIGGTLAALALLALPNLGVISSASGISIFFIAIMIATTLDIAINISFNPTRSIIADVTPEGEQRTKGYTWMQTISGMFGVLAYVIGAFLGNYNLIYLGIFLVLFFSLLPPFFIKEPEQLNESFTPDQINAPKITVSYNQLYRIYFAHAFCWLGVQTMFVYIYAFIKNEMVPMSDEGVGQVIAIAFAVLNTVGFILPALILEPLAKKNGRVKVHALCMGVMALGYGAILFLGTTPMLLYIFMGVVGIGWAATVSLPFAIMTEKVDKTKMGLFMGIFNLSIVIPQLIVSFGFGSIIQAAENKNVIFIISGISLAISAILWTFVQEHAVKKTDARDHYPEFSKTH
ncbi:MAG: MFS transporter [Cyclobacteriaceae bacterium]|nr:MFS transporter [Cyclobacteriaceae bacterium]